MSPVKRDYILYLEDMLQAIDRIEEYLTGLDFSKFKQTYIVVDAIIRNFEILREAAKIFQPIFSKNIRKFPGVKCMRLGI